MVSFKVLFKWDLFNVDFLKLHNVVKVTPLQQLHASSLSLMHHWKLYYLNDLKENIII
jgi:hypothetical protein